MPQPQAEVKRGRKGLPSLWTSSARVRPVPATDEPALDAGLSGPEPGCKRLEGAHPEPATCGRAADDQPNGQRDGASGDGFASYALPLELPAFVMGQRFGRLDEIEPGSEGDAQGGSRGCGFRREEEGGFRGEPGQVSARKRLDEAHRIGQLFRRRVHVPMLVVGLSLSMTSALLSLLLYFTAELTSFSPDVLSVAATLLVVPGTLALLLSLLPVDARWVFGSGLAAIGAHSYPE